MARVFVDGTREMRVIARSAAKKAGKEKELAVFKDGKEALEAIREMPGKVEVITDLMVPGLNGMRLASKLKDRKETEILMCTNVPERVMDTVRCLATDVGIREVYSKEDLLVALKEIGIDSDSFDIVLDPSALNRILTTSMEMKVMKTTATIAYPQLSVSLEDGDRIFLPDDKTKTRLHQVLSNMFLLTKKDISLVSDFSEATVVVTLYSEECDVITDVSKFLRDFSSAERRALSSRLEDIGKILTE